MLRELGEEVLLELGNNGQQAFESMVDPKHSFGRPVVSGTNITTENLFSSTLHVLSIKEEFGQGSEDEVWIPKVAQFHGVVVTFDQNIHRIKAQRQLWTVPKLGMFFFKGPKKKGWNYWEKVQTTVRVWQEMKILCSDMERPFSFMLSNPGPRFHPLELS